MNTIFILVVMFIAPTRELVIVYDDDSFATAAECQIRAVQRVEEAGKQVLWISTSCAEVPKNPGRLKGRP